MLTRKLVWYGLQSWSWAIFLLLILAAVFTAIFLLYRLERKLVSRTVGRLLIGLRFLVVAILLVLLLEPVVTWSIDHSQSGRIVIALDVSDSMKTSDAHAKTAERLRWAKALRMIGQGNNDLQLDRWISAYENNEEPVWVTKEEVADDSKRALRAETLKGNVEGILERMKDISRREMAVSLLVNSDQALVDLLKDAAEIQLITFSGQVQETDRKRIEDWADLSLTAPSNSTSNISLPLTESANETDQPLLGIIVLTDGRDTTSMSNAVNQSRKLGQLNVPIYPIPFGSELRPVDLSISNVNYPLSVFKNDKPLVQIDINSNGFENQSIEVVMTDEEGNQIDSKNVTPKGNLETVEFELPTTPEGRHRYKVAVANQPGETRDDNNEREFSINTTDNTLKVLLVEGEGRWEFRFLQAALSRDQGINLSTVVFKQPFLGTLKKPFFSRELPTSNANDTTKGSAFSDFDLVIIGDVSPSDIVSSDWNALEKFVSQEGGTVFLQSGKHHMPQEHSSESFERLMPVKIRETFQLKGTKATLSPSERGFRMKLSPEANDLALFQFNSNPLENQKIWETLPGHLWGVFGEAKPGSTVWATADLPEGYQNFAPENERGLIVRRQLGYGQVVWMGIDSTWRWRYRVGDLYHDRFWGQLSRWAADRKAASGNESVRFGPKASSLYSGEPAIFEAQWSRSFLKDYPKLKSSVEVYKKEKGMGDKLVSTVPLKSLKDNPVVYQGRSLDLPIGEYRLKLIVEGANFNEESLEAELFVNEPQTAEYSNLSMNYELLQQIANASKGKVIFPDQILDLKKLLVKEDIVKTEMKEQSLWDHWLPLSCLLALLMTEWCLRKWNGLP